MNQLDLRLETNMVVIATLLRDVVTTKSTITLWQNVGNKRIICQALGKEINFSQQKLILMPLGKNFSELAKNTMLFFQTEHKSVLFKVADAVILKDLAFLPIPKEVRVLEMRGEKRLSFAQEFHVPEMNFLKSKAYQASSVDQIHRLSDLSTTGASFIISRGSLTKFYVDEVIQIKSFAMDRLENPLEASIRHISPLLEGKTFSSQHYRVGIKFKHPIDLSRLISIKRPSSLAV